MATKTEIEKPSAVETKVDAIENSVANSYASLTIWSGTVGRTPPGVFRGV